MIEREARNPERESPLWDHRRGIQPRSCLVRRRCREARLRDGTRQGESRTALRAQTSSEWAAYRRIRLTAYNVYHCVPRSMTWAILCSRNRVRLLNPKCISRRGVRWRSGISGGKLFKSDATSRDSAGHGCCPERQRVRRDYRVLHVRRRARWGQTRRHDHAGGTAVQPSVRSGYSASAAINQRPFRTS